MVATLELSRDMFGARAFHANLTLSMSLPHMAIKDPQLIE